MPPCVIMRLSLEPIGLHAHRRRAADARAVALQSPWVRPDRDRVPLFALRILRVVTNLLGGWVAALSGVKVTLYGGLALQIGALVMLAMLDPAWGRVLSVSYVMATQALSGVAKDLTKMSAKTAIKVVVPQGEESALFQWVARLTGSKNALKGAGFFSAVLC
ncbi:MAG TPA: hypothetical protein VMT61_10305 [Candidatus Binataceae bacterium]|nr:hypothetical protein [Candidatus Binataceae bacterium]